MVWDVKEYIAINMLQRDIQISYPTHDVGESIYKQHINLDIVNRSKNVIHLSIAISDKITCFIYLCLLFTRTLRIDTLLLTDRSNHVRIYIKIIFFINSK